MTDEPRGQDSRARSLAQREFERPLVLEAGAGTGKTATLVARVVAWVLGPGWELARERAPEADARRWSEDCLGRVVAITFTDAAAAEMAERVGEALVAVERGEPVIGFDAELLPGDAASGRAQALIGSLDHLVVRTIHAWCRRILAARPLAAGLHPAFEVDAEGEARERAIRIEVEKAFGEEAGGDPGCDWAASLASLASEGVGPEAIAEALDELVNGGIHGDDLREDPFSRECMDRALQDLDQCLAALIEAGTGAFVGVRGNAGPVHEAAESSRGLIARDRSDGFAAVVAWLEAFEAIWEPSLRKKLENWVRADFTKGEVAAAPSSLAAIQVASNALRSRIEALVKVDVEAHERAREVLAPLLDQVHERMRREGWASFAELLRRTGAILEQIPSLRASLRSEIDLLLVDEFQDTDPLQCSIVGHLALDGEKSERPSLFVVGDPKQSIYGWRSADLSAYDDFVERILDEGGERLRLCVNFRSAPAILDEVDRVIEPVMREARGLQPPFQPLLACDDLLECTGYAGAEAAPVEHWLSEGRDRTTGEPVDANARGLAEIEARGLAADLARRRGENVRWKDMAVLFRSMGDLEIYLAAMRDLGIPYAVERDRTWFERREVIDAAAAVRCVVDPQDHLALLTWLRSPAVGVPDAALIPLWTRHLPSKLTELAGPDPEALAGLTAAVSAAAAATPDDVPGLAALGDWSAHLIDAIEGLAILRASFAREASDRFVERLRRTWMQEISEASRFLGPWRVANLDRFFRQLAHDLARGVDIHSVLRHLRTGIAERREAEAGRPGDPSLDAVRVMTIHKSKGLDFEHVYVAQLHKQPGGNHPKRVRIETASGRIDLELFGSPGIGFAAARARRAAVAASERVRELYVAMTRAKSRVVLMGRRAADEVGVERAKSLADLLGSRRGASPSADDLAAAATEAGGGEPAAGALDGALWRLPALFADEAVVSEGDGVAFPDPAEIEDEIARSAARVSEAESRMQRPRSGRATPRGEDETPSQERDARAERWSGMVEAADPEAESARTTAMAIGSAIHRVLEEWEPEADPASELERQRQQLMTWLAADVGARNGALAILDEFARRPLFDRWVGLASQVIARELPVLRPPSLPDDGPVGFESGIIDLVYRDPESEEIVVADYKTDRVASRAECEALAEKYTEQGRFYTETLQQALELPRAPRFELWFLRAGEVIG